MSHVYTYIYIYDELVNRVNLLFIVAINITIFITIFYFYYLYTIYQTVILFHNAHFFVTIHREYFSRRFLIDTRYTDDFTKDVFYKEISQ